LREQVRKFEAAIILRTIEETSGDRRAAAQKLDIGLSSLYRKLEELEEQKILPEGAHARHEIRHE
jgi:two-component system response regulator AtoC